MNRPVDMFYSSKRTKISVRGETHRRLVEEAARRGIPLIVLVEEILEEPLAVVSCHKA
jgi:predicted HicB family RNase H-like nuclease